MLWVIASEDNGYLPDSATLAFRLRISENRVIALLSDCCEWFEQDASNMLASCKQDAMPETEKRQSREEKSCAGENSFEVFWEAYPKKLGKKEAKASWIKMNGSSLLGELLASIMDWKATLDWQKESGRYIPYPATWLNKELWKDNPRKAVKQGPSLEDQLKALETTNGQRSKSHAN
jgi:hypothetical protein